MTDNDLFHLLGEVFVICADVDNAVYRAGEVAVEIVRVLPAEHFGGADHQLVAVFFQHLADALQGLGVARDGELFVDGHADAAAAVGAQRLGGGVGQVGKRPRRFTDPGAGFFGDFLVGAAVEDVGSGGDGDAGQLGNVL